MVAEFRWPLDAIDTESRNGPIFPEHHLGTCALLLRERMNIETSGIGWSASDNNTNVRSFTLYSFLPKSRDS